MEFNYEIRYKKGKDNAVADALSRDENLKAMNEDEKQVSKITQEGKEDNKASVEIMTDTGDADMDLVCVKLVKMATPPTMTADRARRVAKLAQRLFEHEGDLYHRRRNGAHARVLISRRARQETIAAAHEGLAHFGIKTTLEMVQAAYWWPGMYVDVETYVRACDACQRYNKERIKKDFITLQVGQVFERIALDFVGPLPETRNGNKYILVATEALTRWPIARASAAADADTTAQFIYEDIVMQYGAPTTILTDRGVHFLNRMIATLTETLDIRHAKTTGYHPQTNGMTERFNGTLCKALAKCAYETGEDWDNFISTILFAYRVRKQSTTQHSPFYLLYGTEATIPALLRPTIDQLVEREEQITTIQGARTKLKKDRQTKASRFQLGGRVLLKHVQPGNKMEPKFHGPYEILGLGPNNTYRLEAEDGREFKTLISGDRLKRYHAKHQSLLPRPDEGGETVVPAVPGHDPRRAEGVIGSRLEVTASVRDE